MIELFFKETTPSHIENLKSENDEVLLEEIQLKEEEIPDEKSEIGFKKNAETQENEVEKKMNEMNIVGDIGGSINMDEAIDMSKTVKKPSKLQWNVDNLELLDFFFSYLEKKPYLINSTSLGYFFKIANALLNKKFDHVIFKNFVIFIIFLSANVLS